MTNKLNGRAEQVTPRGSRMFIIEKRVAKHSKPAGGCYLSLKRVEAIVPVRHGKNGSAYARRLCTGMRTYFRRCSEGRIESNHGDADTLLKSRSCNTTPSRNGICAEFVKAENIELMSLMIARMVTASLSSIVLHSAVKSGIPRMTHLDRDVDRTTWCCCTFFPFLINKATRKGVGIVNDSTRKLSIRRFVGESSQ